MLFEEAQWVGKSILKYTESGKTVLNLGSSTNYARTILQPQMEKFIFAPLRKNNVKVIHSDISNEEGVDLVGDFTDPKFVQLLSEKKSDIVMCCNLLEHLEDRTLLVGALNKIVPENGYLLLTVPYQYPYHLDPIDTLYRPDVEELVTLFPYFELIEGKVLSAQRQVSLGGTVKYHKNYYQMLKDSPKLFAKLLFRTCLPFYKYPMWKITFNDLKRIFKPFTVTCVVLKKK